MTDSEQKDVESLIQDKIPQAEEKIEKYWNPGANKASCRCRKKPSQPKPRHNSA